MHIPKIDPYDPNKSDGSHSMTSTCARQGIPVVYRGREPRSRVRIGCHYSRTMPGRASE
jgi:hypothetical protein